MKLSDQIAALILSMIEANEEGCAHIRRNELAARLGCVPSQINYVIATRFNGQTGYFVESRRGGGGGIAIYRLNYSKEQLLCHICSSLPEELSRQETVVYLEHLQSAGVLSLREARLLQIATDNAALCAPPSAGNQKRAQLLCQMLTALGASLS